jgi:hypothetical protein
MTRALYRLYDATGVSDYKVAADRYAVFLMNTLNSPYEPYTSKIMLDGKQRNLFSSSWMYGKALSPCYEWFCLHNPREDAFELKALAIHGWLQKHRRPDSYFGVGYPQGKIPDAQFSCDLGEVGSGLVGYYLISKRPEALQDALGLAKFFLTDYEPGSGRGIWSPKLGVWLVGPWPGGGAEHFSTQSFSETGWGWSAYIDAEFLLRLRPYVKDEKLRALIDDHCLRALRWCFDVCQFDDGAHGMFGRDDKWVGMGAAALLLYLELKARDLVPADTEAVYRPRVEKSWRWLVDNTRRETFPADGYIRVTGTTSKKPLENLAWLMAWTTEALLEGSKVFPEPGKGR